MKKIITFILSLCIVLTFAACTDSGKSTLEITMQDIYDANQIETLLAKHQSIFIQEEMDDKIFREGYLTKKYSYAHYPDDEHDAAQYMTDDTSYAYNNGSYLRYLYVTPGGVTNDFASDRAELLAPVVDTEIVKEIIESVNEKDSRITVRSYLSQEFLALEKGIASCKNEYVLDAKTHEIISLTRDYTFEDETTFHLETKVTYDAEEPETLDLFLKYANQTDDLRSVTVVSNPGSEKETSQNFRIPKGLIVGFSFGDDFEDKVAFYADEACTVAYDPYTGTEADLTVYIKWTE